MDFRSIRNWNSHIFDSQHIHRWTLCVAWNDPSAVYALLQLININSAC